ncbi:exonuclease, putative [Plasmodium berghei]|uniref:Exonuclease, putative n=2 Tax=Plasmodium berghei TaxID=5821 RepID=A0A509AJ58_PLABA|nr:exonuclease, putative [Plasmodium berghei ANKA]CXI46417.1 exonuclease, putative [Plasmodium berghei]SCM22783.1 exonuclease, putative [Plasmodium berghei]SCN25685.1 exonuclease, putative [Plasmodium berghei]SCO60609.1 exonuclease, putative [Plasmodium berghei]SCO62341.1 exonuclease, putative [Plasmodium berghei]|eukprot:XP_034421758.1 exonuclease, putative [Plasmodium berghei ANKA]
MILFIGLIIWLINEMTYSVCGIKNMCYIKPITGNVDILNRKNTNFPNRKQKNKEHNKLYGIPRMYKWLTSYYPTVREELINYGQKKKVDIFYIDMNGVIHHCTHANKDALPIHDEHELFSNILHYLKNLFYLVKPQKLVYIGVDGVSPKAKMNQQRKRRFLSLFKINDNSKITNLFNPNCITTGTDFMYKINLSLNKWFKILKKKKVFNFDIIYSGSDVPGEGEHKILKFIRENCKNDSNFKNWNHCIYGLDADLIMLSLVTHLNNIFILRDKFKLTNDSMHNNVVNNIEKMQSEFNVNSESDPNEVDNNEKEISINRELKEIDKSEENKNMGNNESLNNCFNKTHKYTHDYYLHYDELNSYDFEILDIYKLRSSIKTQIATYINKLKKEKNIIFSINRVVDDIVFLSFLVGNDFLPHIPNIDINEGSMNEILNSYIFYIYKYSNYITYKDKVHIERLKIILKILSGQEYQYFKKRGINENIPEFTDEKKYKSYYYLHKFGVSDSKQIQQIVKKYIEGLFWNLHYYHFGCASWHWEYPYHYAPLCSDLLSFEKSDFFFEKGKPYSAYTHLISVLPQKDKNLLPDPYKNVYAEDEVKSFFPDNVKIDPNGKKETWEYIVHLPFINCNMINKIVSEKSKKISRLKYKLRELNGREHRY